MYSRLACFYRNHQMETSKLVTWGCQQWLVVILIRTYLLRFVCRYLHWLYLFQESFDGVGVCVCEIFILNRNVCGVW